MNDENASLSCRRHGRTRASAAARLIEAGFDVTGTTRSAYKLAMIEAAGARAIVLDGLDAASVARAVSEARSDVVIHEFTSLSKLGGNPRKFDQDFAITDRLRMDGTDHLLAAAVAAGAKRFIAQNYAGWPNERTGRLIKDENDPLDPTPVAASLRTVEAIRHMERAVTHATGLEGLALRYGSLYGPGTGLGRGGQPPGDAGPAKIPRRGGGSWCVVVLPRRRRRDRHRGRCHSWDAGHL